ncbi:MAG: class I SAM-dependent methyltransferase [Candidatus Paceibacterota bacterium]|jgi:SAM-dependent methyltransferase
MKFTDNLWINNWSKEYYSPIVNNYENVGIIVGTDPEPKASLCIASFINAMGEKYKEEMKILDYGCGSARVSNFLSKRLKFFHYIGLEKFESNWTNACISKAIELFGNDNRIELGFTESELEKKAIEISETVLLLSVFTHTTIEETEKILNKLLPIVERGGNIIFSMIHGDKYELRGTAYDFVDNYQITYNTLQQVNDLKIKLNINIDLIDTFDAGALHSIYRVTKK